MIQKNIIKPYLKIKPKEMKPLEQVLCMVYLAQTNTFKQLRRKQSILEQQIKSANKHALAVDDLLAMQSNVDAAVAYQSFPDDPIWLSFIRQ